MPLAKTMNKEISLPMELIINIKYPESLKKSTF